MSRWLPWIPALTLGAALFSQALPADAHCDTMDGPVISAARVALDTGDVNRVLIWVQPGDEAQIRERFDATMARRQQSPEQLVEAERAFFEDLVRIHRAGEGAPFEGVKPAGAPIEPAVAAADEAIERGDATGVNAIVGEAVQRGVDTRFRDVIQKRAFDPGDVAAGRDFVASYVQFTHYVEGLNDVATRPPAPHDHAGPDHLDGDHASHASHASHLGWLFSGLMGVALLGQTYVTRRRRRRDPGASNDTAPNDCGPKGAA